MLLVSNICNCQTLFFQSKTGFESENSRRLMWYLILLIKDTWFNICLFDCKRQQFGTVHIKYVVLKGVNGIYKVSKEAVTRTMHYEFDSSADFNCYMQ